jgi:hypothetical protein
MRSEQLRGLISAAVIAAWGAGDWRALNRLLNVRPWEWSPFDAVGERPPEWLDRNRLQRRSFEQAAELRRVLLEVAGPPGSLSEEWEGSSR